MLRIAGSRHWTRSAVGGLRIFVFSAPAFVLCACSPSMPKWPNLSLSMPKIEMADFGLASRPERLVPAKRYDLDAAETRSLRSAVGTAFPPGWEVAFLSGNAGRLPDGSLAACGVVTARDGNGNGARTFFYRVGQDSGATATGLFTLRQIGSKGSDQLSIYSECSAMKLM